MMYLLKPTLPLTSVASVFPKRRRWPFPGANTGLLGAKARAMATVFQQGAPAALCSSLTCAGEMGRLHTESTMSVLLIPQHKQLKGHSSGCQHIQHQFQNIPP